MSYTQDVFKSVLEKNPGEIEFHQAVKVFFESIERVLEL